ncbi:MAG: hypothetical protein VXW65_14895 [Pseudomonadota bacterium]|nr:hypothetical protein [Pseudomonadota bacterium]
MIVETTLALFAAKPFVLYLVLGFAIYGIFRIFKPEQIIIEQEEERDPRIIFELSNLKGLEKKDFFDEKDIELFELIKKNLPNNFQVFKDLNSWSFITAEDGKYIPASLHFAICNDKFELIGAVLINDKFIRTDIQPLEDLARKALKGIGLEIVRYTRMPSENVLKHDLQKMIAKGDIST